MPQTLTWLLAGCVALLTAHAAVNARLLRRPPARVRAVGATVSVLLPVRDEAHRVEPCLRALLALRGVPRLEIIVLDDGSSDGTAERVRAIGADRIRVVPGTPPPPGWLGKPHACHQLAALAAGEVLAFVDADVVLTPDAVAAGVRLLDGFALVCPYPRLVVRTWSERLVQPLLPWSWLTFLPLRLMERARHPALAAAGGQFLLVDRAAYQRAGGHAAVRGEVLEDVALARAVKRAGGRIALADGSRLAACRMYTDWRQLRDGYTKSLWAALGPPPGAAVVVVALLFWYLLPLALLPLAPVPAVAAVVLGVAGRAVTAGATGGRVLPDCLLHPVSILIVAYLVVRSFVRRRTVRWKGRPVT